MRDAGWVRCMSAGFPIVLGAFFFGRVRLGGFFLFLHFLVIHHCIGYINDFVVAG